jgi:3-phosphoshikimate 1-carboxyvinyltransferase
MRPFKIWGLSGVRAVKGKLILPGDKSIAHRSVILSALSRGSTVIHNFPANKDCLATLEVFKKLGIKSVRVPIKNSVSIQGKGLFGLKKPESPIFIEESGTTYRLLLGVLAGQDFSAELRAGKLLSRRPMLRVTAPLRRMGAQIMSGFRPQTVDRRLQTSKEEYPPLFIKGASLRPIIYKIPVASAQVKSALLLAGLYVNGTTRIIEPVKTRDHTEKMLKFFKADIKIKGNSIFLKGAKQLVCPRKVFVPGDISSAAFFIVLASILPGSRLVFAKVSLNPSRMGLINVLKRMGADIRLSALSSQLLAEPMGNITVKSSVLKGTVVRKEEIPSLIDELPVLMVAAAFARGKTVFNGVEELRVKETDRIASMMINLKAMGGDCRVSGVGLAEKIIINGKGRLNGAKVKSFSDHRTAMSMMIAGMAACGRTEIDDIKCIGKSFPGFTAILKSLVTG